MRALLLGIAVSLESMTASPAVITAQADLSIASRAIGQAALPDYMVLSRGLTKNECNDNDEKNDRQSVPTARFPSERAANKIMHMTGYHYSVFGSPEAAFLLPG